MRILRLRGSAVAPSQGHRGDMTVSEQSIARSEAAPAWVRRPANLASAVAAELVGRIVRGQHAPGTVLPAEPALCDTFSVSRTVVREAVKMLQAKGLVQVRQGSGTTVAPPAMWNMLDELVLAASIAEDQGLSVLDDLVVTRRLLESDMAHTTAQLATEDVVRSLRELVDQMDALLDDHDRYADCDRIFHDLIMQTSGNRIARAVVRALERQVGNSARYVGQPQRERRVASNRDHRRVYEHIAAHEPEAAAAAMFSHITEAWLVRRGGADQPAHLRH
ncbi:MAG: FadR family transcriptional regulator [Micromonosporaceae bacterium]|nr:FadR family transcriptional regulator [Micromonosporaceae bacterium]